MAWLTSTSIQIKKRRLAGREMEYAVYDDEFIVVWGEVERNRQGRRLGFPGTGRLPVTDGSDRVIRERLRYEKNIEWPGLTEATADKLIEDLAKDDNYMSAESTHFVGGGYTVTAVERTYDDWGHWFPEYTLAARSIFRSS